MNDITKREDSVGKKDNEYFIDDCGLLIGLVSKPSNIEGGSVIDITKFYNKEIKENLSEKYKRGRKKNCISGKGTIDEHLYNPFAFRMFSDYDIAVFTLIDDLSYPHRVFNPSHGCREKGDTICYNYDYQVMTCLNTLLSKDNCSITLKSMRKKLLNDKYPYICITKAKLNNIFLVENGIDFTELVKNTIRTNTLEYNGNKDVIDTYVFDSLGSEEIIIVNFARNFSSIATLLQKTRCLLFDDLKIIGHNNILHNLNIKNPDIDIEWNKSHVFCSVYSSTGYSFDLVKNFENYKFIDEDDDKHIEIMFDWDIKPGHPIHCRERFQTQIKKISEHEDREDFMRIEHNSGNYSLEMKNTAPSSEFFKIIEELRNLDPKKEDIRKLHLSVSIGFKGNVEASHNFSEENCSSFDREKHLINSHIYDLKIGKLSEIRNYLSKANISKMLRERVMKMYNNYNHCIEDPLFVGSFIDFYPFMKSFAENIREYAEDRLEQTSENFQEWITKCVDGFEQAYYNRFHQSSRMRNMTDFNLEWNGSLLQIISPIDGLYKEMLAQTGYCHYDKFIYISGFNRVISNDKALRINILFLTYPELFVTEIWKEVFNYQWYDLSQNQKGNPLAIFQEKEYLSFLNRGISNYKDFEASNGVHEYLLNYLVSDTIALQTYIADTLAFSFSYDKDYELFSYWYWKAFLQTSPYYDKAGKFDSKIFIRCLSRLLFIKLLKDEDPEELRFKPFDSSISEMWLFHFEDVLSFTKILLKVLEWSHFNKKFNQYVLVMENLIVKKCNEFIPSSLKEEESLVVSAFSKYLVTSILDNFRKGMIPILSDKLSEVLFIKVFIQAFLLYMKELNEENKKSGAQVLIRNESEIDDCYKREGMNPILSDMQGGLFCLDSDVQKKCFKARALFYRTIFHYTMKYTKKNIIENKQ